MKSQEVSIGALTQINVTMTESAFGLEDVVVIGYGTIKKSDLTGAVGVIKSDVISNRKDIQISQALQGTMPGLMVTRDNTDPGSTATLRIRGITTIGDSNPLIIIDGVPGGSIDDVNPNDIESISVLKDAASASIYGSRAAAGVILLTTKRAKSGDLKLEYNYEFGFEKPTEMPKYVGAVRYMQMLNELRWNDNNNIVGGEYSTFTQDIINNYSSLHTENPDLYPDVNWLNLILKDNALRQSHFLNISSGSKLIKTKASLAYDEIGGLYMMKDFKRFTVRVNNDITINKYLSASLDFYAKREISNNPSVDPIYYGRLTPNIYAPEWSDGLVAEGKTGSNIYGELKYGGFKNYWDNQLGGKISINLEPFNGLKFSAVLSPQFSYYKGKEFRKKIQYTAYDNPNVLVGTLVSLIDNNASTNLNEIRNDNYNVTLQLLANYTKSFGNHNMNATFGYENYYASYESLSAYSNNFTLSNYPYLDLGNTNFLQNTGSAYENAYRSFFGRILYNYKNKYLLQGNVRTDGSSRFYKDYRWGIFPSVSAGWVLSEETFMKNSPIFSFLKLRGSWGTLGNDRIGNYPYQSAISFHNALMYNGSNVSSVQTSSQDTYAIKDISWETTRSLDFGIDVNFFKNKLNFSGDYYKKVTKDMLLALEIPDYIGFNNPDQNTGKMVTTGWEISLGWNDKIGELVGYSVSANLSDSRSIMGDLGGIQFLGDQVKYKGSEYNEWYGYISEGLYQTQDDVNNSAKINASVKPGDIKYKDTSGPNGVPDGIINNYDKVLLGGSLPRYLYGGNISLNYKNFDFSLGFLGIGKQNVRLSSLMVQPFLQQFGNAPELIDGNYYSIYNTEVQNLAAKYPRLSFIGATNNYVMSDYWLFNGAYFRLKNISLGYTIPQQITEKLHIMSVRIYSSVSDLLSINKYPKGWDPEVTVSGYPVTTSFIFGLSIKF
jgi:TonB-linked SusC/RagA family outer membrane protein